MLSHSVVLNQKKQHLTTRIYFYDHMMGHEMKHYGPFNAVFVVSVILSLLVCKEDPDAFPAYDPMLEKGNQYPRFKANT